MGILLTSRPNNEGFTKIVNLITARADVFVLEFGHIGHTGLTVEMHVFFKNAILYSLGLDLTNYI